MIASVQYNDLRGTAAADVSDFYMNSLQKYLVGTYKTYDSERYVCRGCVMWISDQMAEPSLSMSFLCWDKTAEKFVRFYPKKHMDLKEAFSLFKRFEVVMGTDISDIDVNDDDCLDLI